MKKTIFTIITALFTGLSFPLAPACGQALTGPCEASVSAMIQGSHLLCTPYRDLNPFHELPGELNQWGWGTVFLNTGDSVTGRFLVYNSVGSNLLTVKYGTETLFGTDKSTIRKFVFRSEKQPGKVYTFEFFPVSGWYYSDGDGAFLEVLVKDTVSLYHLATIEKFPMSDNLKGHHYYFLQQAAGDLKKVRPNRKSLCKALDCSRNFQKHLKSLHLKADRKERMIESVKEYNQFMSLY